MNFLITGASGFIGSTLCSRLASGNKVIGIYHIKRPGDYAKITWEQEELANFGLESTICDMFLPDVVIHCSGIAHQKIGTVDSATYIRLNSDD